MDETTRHKVLGTVKRIGLVDAQKLNTMIYDMKYDTYDGIEFTSLLEKEEFNKEKFFEFITNMVKVLELCNDIHTKCLK